MLITLHCGTLVSWGNAWLAGCAGLDEVDRSLDGSEQVHRAVGVPGEPGPVSLAVALGRLRGDGLHRLSLAVAAPGDPVGLAGPPAFTAAATEAGAAVLAVGTGLGLVPTQVGAVVRWDLQPALAPALVPDLGEASAQFRTAVTTATALLEQLEVARDRAEVAGSLADLSHLLERHPAPLIEPRTLALLATAARVDLLVRLAGRDDGAALTAAQARARGEALRPAAAAARRLLVAAYSAAPEPGPARRPHAG
ncbi:MAG TPA: hypothetical protein VFN19_06090 [Candidatus Nanopelagicales bacterium]|nr:hypothetical protein [Candidatus Nanopelagicales bacterium]